MLTVSGVRQTRFESGGFLFVASAAAAIVLGVLISADPQGHGFVLALGAIVAATLAVATIRNPAFGGYVLVGAVPVMSGLKRGLFVPGLRPSEVLIGGLATLILVIAPAAARRPWRTFDWLALSYCFATLILGSYDLLQRGVAFNGGLIGNLLGPFQFFLLYRAVIVALPSQKQLARAIIVLLAMSIPVAVLAILQHFDLMSSRALIRTATGMSPSDLNPANDRNFVLGDRATGPFPAWHALGGYLVIIVLLSVACLFESFHNRRIKLVSTTALILGVPALFVAGSAAPILGAAAGCLLLGIWLGRLKRAMVILLTGTLVAVLLFAPLIEARYGAQFHGQFNGQKTVHGVTLPQTLAFRYDIWTKQYFPLLSGERLLTGYGPDTPVGQGITWVFTETLYLTLVMRGGLILLFVYGALMCVLASDARRAAIHEDGLPSSIARALLAAVIVFVPMHFVSSYFVASGMPHLLWVMAGFVAAMSGQREVSARLARAREAHPISSRPSTKYA